VTKDCKKKVRPTGTVISPECAIVTTIGRIKQFQASMKTKTPRDEGLFREGWHDPEQHLKLGAAVYDGCVPQVARDQRRELAEQKDAQSTHSEGQDQAGIVAHQSHPLDQDEAGNQEQDGLRTSW
jgi:hypothetical protein